MRISDWSSDVCSSDLHLGHAWSALQAHDLARRAGGQFRLRIEDIDGARSRTEYVAAILEDLRWLGLRWDGDAVFQSERLPIYNAALEKLDRKSTRLNSSH